MKITDFIAKLMPKSARTRDLAIQKLEEHKTVSGIFFLIQAAQAGDITSLMGISTLLLKEGRDCPKTKEVIRKYMQQVLGQEANTLAKKILASLAAPTYISKPNLKANAKQQNVVAWDSNRYKSRP